MKKEDLLEKSLEKILEYLEKAEAFTIENAPLYVKELLEYDSWYHLTLIFIIILAFTIFLAIFMMLIKKEKHDAVDFVGALLILFSIVSLPFAAHSFFKYNKIQKAPRVYLLEELRHK